MKKLIQIMLVGSIFINWHRPVAAVAVLEAGTSASPVVATMPTTDSRVTKLKAYLEMHNSPLAESAGHFVSEADRLDLDWKLVAAIAGVESTFGKHVPRNSYNGWGWGIFTGASDGKHFRSWNDGITTVSEGLKYNYVDKGASSLEQMGRKYAASPVWSAKVRFFLNKIEAFEQVGVDHLAVTI